MTTRGRVRALAAALIAAAGPVWADGPIPVMGGPGATPIPLTPPVHADVAGSVFAGYRGTDGQTTGAVLTAAPWRALFVRVGGEVTPWSKDGSVRLQWGAGFEEWRGNTFFAHVQDDGPIRPDDRFTLRHGEATAGYKLPLLCAGVLCLSESAFAGLPFTGGAFLGARMTLTVARTWYLSGGFGWTIPDALPGDGDAAPWRLFYGIGRWDWRPGGLFLTYRDEIRVARLSDWRSRNKEDRQGRGVVAAGVSFSY